VRVATTDGGIVEAEDEEDEADECEECADLPDDSVCFDCYMNGETFGK
jgi:hypothetical protein